MIECCPCEAGQLRMFGRFGDGGNLPTRHFCTLLVLFLSELRTLGLTGDRQVFLPLFLRLDLTSLKYLAWPILNGLLTLSSAGRTSCSSVPILYFPHKCVLDVQGIRKPARRKCHAPKRIARTSHGTSQWPCSLAVSRQDRPSVVIVPSRIVFHAFFRDSHTIVILLAPSTYTTKVVDRLTFHSRL